MSEDPAPPDRVDDASGRSGHAAMRVGVRAVAEIASLILPLALVAWLFIAGTVSMGSNVPHGRDAPDHLWRLRVATAEGLPALFDSAPSFSTANVPNPDRMGFPTLAAVLSATADVGPWRLVFLASVLAVAIAACGAWAVGAAIGEPVWARAVYALAIGTSVQLALTGHGHLDNAIADGLLVSLAALLIRVANDGPGVAAGIVLLAGTMLMHWAVGLVGAGIDLTFAGLLIVVSWRAREAWWRTPTARVAAIGLVGAGAGGAILAFAPSGHGIHASAGGLFERNVRRLLPVYRLPLVLPLAAAGGLVSWFASPRERRRRALLLWIAWLLIVGAVAVLYELGRTLPLMRVIAVAFPLVFLPVALLVWGVGVAGRIRGPLRYLAIVVAAAALIAAPLWWSASNAYSVFRETGPMTTAEQTTAIRTAAAYMRRLRWPGPLAIPGLAGKDERVYYYASARVRAFMPGRHDREVNVYYGDVEHLLEGRPTPFADPQAEAASRESMRALEWSGWTPSNGVVLVLRPFDPSDFRRLSGSATPLGPDVLLVRGPAPDGPVRAAPLVAPTSTFLGRYALFAFGVLWLTGIGWAFALLPGAGPGERAALSPALGLAVTLLVTVPLSLAGVLVSGSAGRWAVALAALAGWVVAGARTALSRRDRATPTGAAPRPPASSARSISMSG